MSRRPLALLPGMMCDERLFGPQRAALEATHEVRVARFADGDTIEAFAREALAPFDPGDGPVDLVGLSMGGIVAMGAMALAPQRVGRVVLLDTNHLAESAERRASRAPQIERALAGELDRVLIDDMKPAYLAPANRDDEALLGLVLDMARGLGPDVFERQSRAIAGRPDRSATLRGWTGPLALACGAHDALCPPERHREMAALVPHATLEVIEDAGHLTTLERPDAVGRLLARALGDAGPGPADAAAADGPASR